MARLTRISHIPILYLCIALLGAGLLITTPAFSQNFANWTPDNSSSQTVPDLDDESLDQLSMDEIRNLAGTQPVNDPIAQGGSDRKYTLGQTDVIEITVMRHPEVSGEYVINKEGNIQYEFVGDVPISGLTKFEAADTITKKLEEFIVAPEVTVKITQYNSKVVYVVGEVFRPGKVFMRGDTITVREALIQAGLPRLSGITKKSRLITPNESGRPKKKNINVYALLYEGDLRQNDIMKPGDILYVPPTLLTKTMRAISPITAPIGQAAGARVGVDTLGGTQGTQ